MLKYQTLVHVAPLRKHLLRIIKVVLALYFAASRFLQDEITSYELHKRSIDARKRNDIVLILTYHVNVKVVCSGTKTSEQIQGGTAAKHIKLAEPNTLLPKQRNLLLQKTVPLL